jgi:hypothetical protein
MLAADFCDLLRCYQDWEGRLRSHPTKQALGVKLELLSGAIARATSDGHVAALRKLMRAVSLKRPSRGLVLALFKYGTIADLMYLLNRIASEKDRVDYWNHLELGRAVTTRLSNRHERVPQALIAVAKRKEFGRYMPREERSKQARDALLPLANVDNRALYIRLVAYGIIGAAKSEEIQPLVQLCSHEYTSIARAAASQLAHLLDRQALRILAENIDIGVQQGAAASLAEALRSAEMAVFRVVGLG